jgi:putative FmdB family regulatory protein
MPIYEYECDNCGTIIEKWHSINDSSYDSCDCGGKLTKIISRTTFHLKGSGWYVTDYCKRNSNDNGNSKTTTSSDNASDASNASKDISCKPAATPTETSSTQNPATT